MLNNIWTSILAFFTSLVMMFYTPTPVARVNPGEIPQPEKTQTVKVMTYNVYVAGAGEKSPVNRTPLVVENIRAHMPDSFGLEECNEGWYERIKEAMPEYGYTGQGRNNAAGKGEASPVFYLKEKYELVDSDTFWLSKTPEKPSKGWDAMYKRVCTYAILKNKETGFTYAHFNAHFDHIGVKARMESVAVITAKIAEICPDLPVVFTGDLNDDQGTPMYERIIESGLRDTKFEAAQTMDVGTYHGYSEATEAARALPIDFIFVNGYCSEVASYTVDFTKYNGIYPSDHHPVISELTLFNGGK